MNWPPSVAGLRCPACERTGESSDYRCRDCDEPLTVSYETENWAALRSDSTRSDLWQFESYLPISRPPTENRSVGGTPLCESQWLREELGVKAAYIKDEGRNPTGHVSDRDMAVIAAWMETRDERTLALPSPGRSGIAAAAAAASAGSDSRTFVPSRAPFAAKALINVHGGEMRVVPGRYGDARSTFDEARPEKDWIDARPLDNPLAREGRKTVYVELLAALNWTVPDVLVVPAGSGATIHAVTTTATQLAAAGIVEGVPRFVIAQPAGCAPLVDGLEAGTAPSSWEKPDTICGELEIPAPRPGEWVLETIRNAGGDGVAVPDPATLEAAVRVAQEDGLEVSVAGGVALAGATDQSFDPEDTVVVINPGSAAADADVLRSHLMGQGI